MIRLFDFFGATIRFVPSVINITSFHVLFFTNSLQHPDSVLWWVGQGGALYGTSSRLPLVLFMWGTESQNHLLPYPAYPISHCHYFHVLCQRKQNSWNQSKQTPSAISSARSSQMYLSINFFYPWSSMTHSNLTLYDSIWQLWLPFNSTIKHFWSASTSNPQNYHSLAFFPPSLGPLKEKR